MNGDISMAAMNMGLHSMSGVHLVHLGNFVDEGLRLHALLKETNR